MQEDINCAFHAQPHAPAARLCLKLSVSMVTAEPSVKNRGKVWTWQSGTPEETHTCTHTLFFNRLLFRRKRGRCVWWKLPSLVVEHLENLLRGRVTECRRVMKMRRTCQKQSQKRNRRGRRKTPLKKSWASKQNLKKESIIIVTVPPRCSREWTGTRESSMINVDLKWLYLRRMINMKGASAQWMSYSKDSISHSPLGSMDYSSERSRAPLICLIPAGLPLSVYMPNKPSNHSFNQKEHMT